MSFLQKGKTKCVIIVVPAVLLLLTIMYWNAEGVHSSLKAGVITYGLQLLKYSNISLQATVSPAPATTPVMPDSTASKLPLAQVVREWRRQPKKMSNLNQNPVYARFNTSRTNKPPFLDMLLIVTTAPGRADRRSAIRDTWWSQCNRSGPTEVTVKCYFATDDIRNKSTALARSLIKESEAYGDLIFQHIPGNNQFGKRFLYHMVWAVQKYNFNYFLRVDDDYFLCFERIQQELAMPRQFLFHWGYTHCEDPHLVRPEESMIMLSRDVVELYLSQDIDRMACHPLADQMIGEWTKKLALPIFYSTDTRIHHHPPISFVLKDSNQAVAILKDVCQRYIGLHGAYPDAMRLLWQHRGPSDYTRKPLTAYMTKCVNPVEHDWQRHAPEWRFEPVPCIEEYEWNTGIFSSQGQYTGRQGS